MGAATPLQPIRIELPFAIDRTMVNVYLFLEPEPVLVDTGDSSPEAWEALVAGMAEHGVQPADLASIIITHVHIDHFGQGARLSEESGADFYILAAGYRWLTQFEQMWTERLTYYRSTFLPGTGMPAAQQAQVLAYSQWVLEHYRSVPAHRVTCLRPEEQIALGGCPWQVLHLPGHASTQTCFYQAESRSFLASDMLLQRTPTPVTEPPQGIQPRSPALPQFVESLAQVAALPIQTTYPGHGPSFGAPGALITRQLERIARRKQECCAHLQAGASSVYELVKRMYPPTPHVNMAGLWMVVGYLDLLEAEGRVAMTPAEGVWRYATN